MDSPDSEAKCIEYQMVGLEYVHGWSAFVKMYVSMPSLQGRPALLLEERLSLGL